MTTRISPRVQGVVREAVGHAIVRDARAHGYDVVATKIGEPEAAIKRWDRDGTFPVFTTAQRVAPIYNIDPESGKAVKP